ncbi:nitroreductase family protein [Paenibacillus sacheonensis]|uniref:Putative NAD(P)H nitroreductase n=1 Tax=Paenibacillus sacheonensis TaxID=742054 RepID=A0A7X4YNA1_9BACL|nr:nitroreductase [Paenibacillus sacheonensis]MBM7565575.1 nitroreductase [Paenibacillus sacheonensis]NBC69506.1 nitroreductase [Paenibacillus sacheonensis]
MNVIEAIRTRRSIGKVTQEPIARETIEQILEAGTWAPNHRLTEPWQFFVMSGEGRVKLGQALGAIALRQAGEGLDAEAQATKTADALTKAKRAPVVIGVAVVPVERRDVIELEEYGAVNAAIQNMLLTVHALGLGAVWRTGEPCFHPLMNEAFGLRPQDKMLGFLYIGVPDMTPAEGKRSPAAGKTTWIEA